MDIREELKSAGVYPSGPCSAWPSERNEELMGAVADMQPKGNGTVLYSQSNPEIQATAGRMARGLAKTALAAMKNGKVSSEIRNERYETCKACPLFRHNDKRCSDCGCFMEAKTWVNANPNTLCPQKKWSR